MTEGMTKTPLYIQLADEIAEQIASRELSPGSRLPPQRDLAYARGVTTGTVLRAYAELQRQGLIESTVGRGSFVRRAPLPADSPGEMDLRANRPPLRSLAQDLLKTVAQNPGRFDESLLVDRMLFSSVHARHEEAAARWLAKYHAVNIQPAPLLCSSAQHALAVSLLTLCKPGDVVAAEESAYTGITMLAGMLNLKIVGVVLDENGLVPEALAAICKRHRPKVLFCMPNSHSPTTSTIPEERRHKIAAIARKHDFWIVQDDVYGAYLENLLPPFRAIAPERSIFFTSFSKVVALGASVGFISVPQDLREQISSNIRIAGATAAPIFCETITQWMEEGRLDEIIVANRTEIAARAAVARSILGEAGLVSKPDCPHAWLPLPASTSLPDFTIRVQHHGIKLMRSDQFAVEHPIQTRAAVRISLGGAPNRTILTDALTKIKHVLQLASTEIPMT